MRRLEIGLMDRLDGAASAVLKQSEQPPPDARVVAGPPTSAPPSEVLNNFYAAIGFQATHLSMANEQLREALRIRETINSEGRRGCTLYCGVAANLMATGVREGIVFLARHCLVDSLVISAGGLEHDLARALCPQAYTIGCYASQDRHATSSLGKGTAELMGNVSRDRSALKALDEFLSPMILRMIDAQSARFESAHVNGDTAREWVSSPSTFWREVGEELIALCKSGRMALQTAQSTLLYWAAECNIPLFSPNFADGDAAAIVARVHKQQLQQQQSLSTSDELIPSPPCRLIIDLVKDIDLLNRSAIRAVSSAMLILGGGIIKHHVCNANLMRDGADYSVFVNSAQEFDGSDAGARPDEAVSWGKIRIGAKPVKIYAEVSVVFPLLIAGAFLPHLKECNKDSP